MADLTTLTGAKTAMQPRPMDDAALIAAMDDADNRAYGSNLSNLTAALSAERALNIDLYLGKNLEPAPQGESQVIDRTVFETIQSALPMLCRIFANGDDIVTLQPENQGDVQQAKQEAQYLNWFVTQKCDWFSLFLEWATDALLTKNAYMLIYRDKSRKVEIEKYEKQTMQGVALLLQDPDCTILQMREYPAPDLPPDPVMGPAGEPLVDENGQPMTRPAMLYDLTLRRANTSDDLALRVLPPERCKVDQRAFSWRLDDRCNYFEYWEELTLTELREQGFDIPTDIADDPEIYTQEDYARDQYGERRLERYKPSDPSMRRVKARQIWIRVDRDGDGIAELLQVLRVGRRILALEEVSRIPVASAVSCPLPHRHVGIALADITSDIQRIKTVLLRQGINNLYLSNNPQKLVADGAASINTIDDMMTAPPGGIIRCLDINGIRFEDRPFVFPQAVEGMQYMDSVRMNRTGISNTFQGVDSAQLANLQPGTVSQVSSMASERVTQIARILAFGIEDMFAIIHEQLSKLGHKRETIQLRGQWVEIDPGAWKRRDKFKISVAFGAGNKDAQLARLMLIVQKQTEALVAGIPVVNPENLYNSLIELCKAGDVAAPEQYWTDPATIPPAPPKPDPNIAKELIHSDTQKAVEAAKLSQSEVESQRKAVTDKYAIDSNVGLELLRATHQHEHEVNLENIRAHHQASLTEIARTFSEATGGMKKLPDTLGRTHKMIEQHGAKLTNIAEQVADVFQNANKAVAIATGRRVVRKAKDGSIDGVDVHDHEGKVIASHKAIRDEHGRVIGLE